MCSGVRVALSGFFCPPTTAEEIEERERRAERLFAPVRRVLLWACSLLLAYTVVACVWDWDGVLVRNLDQQEFSARVTIISVDITGDALICPPYEDYMREHHIEHAARLVDAKGDDLQYEGFIDFFDVPSFRIGALAERHPYMKKVLCSGGGLSIEVDARHPIQKRLRIYAMRRKVRRKSSASRHVDIVLVNLSASVTFMVHLRLLEHRRPQSAGLNLDKLFVNSPRATKAFLPLRGIESVVSSVRRATPRYPTCDPSYDVAKGVLEAPPGGISIYRIGERLLGPNSKEDCP